MARQGYCFSYDMLGEAACNEADARRYHLAYSDAITALSSYCTANDVGLNPGISVKLSALHPRYEFSQRQRVLSELVPRLASLAQLARSAGMGFNIDAEEADRLELSLDVIDALWSDRTFAGWEGLGVVIQAYAPRAPSVIEWVYKRACQLDRRLMVRLVKGAYWDTEIKRAQVLGLDRYPVFTRKASTDLCYLVCAQKLLQMTDRIYPQFATHNAHTVAAVKQMAEVGQETFEFQRLHGMGEALYRPVTADQGYRCRIYAPVGRHRDLLAYLVRRLLENGANSSFVNQITDLQFSPEEIAADPVEMIESTGISIPNPLVALPPDLFGGSRVNAKGWDLSDPLDLRCLDKAREPFRFESWRAGPMVGSILTRGVGRTTTNPADPADCVGRVEEADSQHVEIALATADRCGSWPRLVGSERADCLERVAELYEQNTGELLALATREAGKTLLDGISEVREAVDFLRYYADRARQLDDRSHPRGIVVCISPWNFPLAIFTGQIAGALAAGNSVIAKPAEQTPLIAALAVRLMHEAGVPMNAIQLLPGPGSTVGTGLISDPRIAAVCFTGSTGTARAINRAMARAGNPDAVLIAETGGLNAMLVDSTALPEQAIRDVLVSAFQSAGQRCSALRLLYLQEDIESRFLDMLFGAMEELSLGDPWALATDIGPVIDSESQQNIEAYCQEMEGQGRLLKKLDRSRLGFSVPPAVYRIKGIEAMDREVFGPILHVASFATDGIEQVVDAVNGRGYGLTFGLHTRIDKRVQRMIDRLMVGNLYVNRNQIGAVVGSQPFGGEGLSGTGPKAGGPFYVSRLRQARLATPDMKRSEMEQTNDLTTSTVQSAIDRVAGLPMLSIRERFERLRSTLAGRWSDLEEVLLSVEALPLAHW